MSRHTKKQRILVVDDSPENIDVLVSLLKDDYMVAAARNGPKALEMAFKNPPDLVLMDIMMPEMDGYEVCRELKAQDSTKDIPVIFVTALTEAMDEVKALNTGAVDYITKPFQPIVVKTRVRTHLNLKEKKDLLEALVSLDGLTNIYNRRKFDETLEEEWKRLSRKSEPLSLILLDIDNFKEFNDHYGHANGDDCLKRLADSLKKNIRRAGDFLGRYGGEEFVVLLPGTELESALHVAEKLRQAVTDLGIVHEYSETAPYVTVSAGVSSTIPDRDKPSGTLIEAADNMLYKSKENGRNQVKGAEADSAF